MIIFCDKENRNVNLDFEEHKDCDVCNKKYERGPGPGAKKFMASNSEEWRKFEAWYKRNIIGFGS